MTVRRTFFVALVLACGWLAHLSARQAQPIFGSNTTQTDNPAEWVAVAQHLASIGCQVLYVQPTNVIVTSGAINLGTAEAHFDRRYEVGYQCALGTNFHGGPVSPVTSPAVVVPTANPFSDGTCTTPDPFVAIGGGRCSHGGWTPR